MEENPISFGEWLTQRRKSLKLTRGALAHLVPCSVSTLRRLEADDLRASSALAAALARRLDIPNGQRETFIAFARGERADLPVGKSPVATSHLPVPLTRLIGRQREIAAVAAALRKPGVRLLTLSGPPGTGKTRLSLAVAHKVAGSFRDGAHFVALAPLAEPEAVAPAIAQVLGVRETRMEIHLALSEYLRDKHLLLVLDNFEHLMAAATLVSELLNAAPQVKALVSSRESLHLYGEHNFPVPALELLDVRRLPTATSLAPFSHCASIQLFKERACAADPGFRLTSQNAADVAQICAWLDGLPLAIEIAAAQISYDPPDRLYAQLRDRLGVLTGGPRDLSPRQQSLRGAMDWSFDLLDEPDRRLFSLLGVFSDGCSEEAICAAQGLIFGGGSKEADQSELKTRIRTLVAKNLLRQERTPEGQVRYWMLATMHDYARDRLAASGRLEQAQSWHCDYYLNFAKTARPNLVRGGNQAQWLTQMEREHNNLRAALGWACAGPDRAGIAMELAWALDVFWGARGYFSEKNRWLHQVLALDPGSTVLRAKLLLQAGDSANAVGDFERARALEKEALAIANELGDAEMIHNVTEGLAILAGMQGDYAQAAERLERVLHYRREMKDSLRLTSVLNNLAIATRRLGDLERARELYVEATEVTKSIGNLNSLAHALIGLGEVYVDLHEYTNAVRYLRESIAVRVQLGEKRGLAYSLISYAMAIQPLGAAVLSTQLESASEKILKELGVIINPAERAANEKFVAKLRDELGEDAFEKAWSGGQRMSPEQAVALAMQDND